MFEGSGEGICDCQAARICYTGRVSGCSGLDLAQDLGLLGAGLEAAVAHLGGSVNELELDLLQGGARHLGEERPPEGDAPLLGAWHGSLHPSHLRRKMRRNSLNLLPPGRAGRSCSMVPLSNIFLSHWSQESSTR
jgi:hypothetical protein